MYKDLIEKELKRVIIGLGYKPTDTLLSISQNSKFGEYSTNIALQLAKQEANKTQQSVHEIANEILSKFSLPTYLQEVSVAGPGFINFYLKDSALEKILDEKISPKTSVKKILVEYADPNTHKEFHIGHLRTLTIGESIARLLEFQGVEVFRSNYGSDIGPTVAKALWGIKKLTDEYQEIRKKSLREKASFLGKAYAFAHSSYEEDQTVKQEIDDITKQLYQRDSVWKELWEETKTWSLGYFDTIYSRMGSEFDLRVNESEVDERGKKVVEDNINKVFVEDQGAIIFPGEQHGLHNRVFITSAGHPTYEGKEVGLIEKYQDIFPFDEALILSDIQQAGFFQVVNRAIEMINPHLMGRKKYIPYGFVSLSTGKMSSRKGNIISAEDLLDQVKEAIKNNYIKENTNIGDQILDKIAVAAIKFYYLKYSNNSDIIYDIDQSIALQGDTGPYLLYTYTRTASVLAKADTLTKDQKDLNLARMIKEHLDPEEKEVLRQLEFFDFKVFEAAKTLSPSELCVYLLDLAKTFNLFYEKHSILASNQASFRLKLTQKVGETLKIGLYLLGIETVERM